MVSDVIIAISDAIVEISDVVKVKGKRISDVIIARCLETPYLMLRVTA